MALGGDSWAQLRESFAEQFVPDGTHFIYRRSQTGEAVSVSSQEYREFLDEYDRGIRRSVWMVGASLVLVLVGILAISLSTGSDVQEGTVYVGIGVVMVPYLAYARWLWIAPARKLAGRTPVSTKLSPDDVRRLRFQRISYGQLLIAALTGLAVPFFGSSDRDVFSGWNRLWLVIGGALVLLAAVQAFRKWRFEQKEQSAKPIRYASNRDIASSPQDSPVQAKPQLSLYLPFALLLLGIAFIAYTASGNRLAQTPGFWPVVMVVLGGWALTTVGRGLVKGQIEPFVRGFYNSYRREAQPKRYWASVAWNALLGGFLLWSAVAVYRQQREEPFRDRCYNLEYNYSAKDALTACNLLIELRPRDSDSYLHRGIIYLNAKQHDQAIADFTRAHELEPTSPWPLANRGIGYVWRGNHRRAEQDFMVVRQIDPDNIVLLHGEGLLSLHAGNLEVAVERFSAALRQDTSDRWALVMRADTYQQMGEFDKARADRERLLQPVEEARR